MLMLPYGQFLAHMPQPMHQSSMMTSSEFAAPDRAHRAADHAQRVAALAAGGGDQVLVEAQPFADQARDAIVRVGAGAYALSQRVHFSRSSTSRLCASIRPWARKLIERHVSGRLTVAARFSAARSCAMASSSVADVGEALEHQLESRRRDADHFHVVERRAGRGARASAEQADLAEISAARQVGEHQLAAGMVLRTPSRSRCAPDRSCRPRRPGGR